MPCKKNTLRKRPLWTTGKQKLRMLSLVIQILSMLIIPHTGGSTEKEQPGSQWQGSSQQSWVKASLELWRQTSRTRECGPGQHQSPVTILQPHGALTTESRTLHEGRVSPETCCPVTATIPSRDWVLSLSQAPGKLVLHTTSLSPHLKLGR